MTVDQIKARRRTAQMGATLVYYDGPQVLTLKGQRDRFWMCVAINAEEEAAGFGYPIFCTQITKDELERYIRGHVDLRFLFLYSKVQDYRIADLSKPNKNGIYLSAKASPPSDWFPDEGFFSRNHTEEVNLFDEEATPQKYFEVGIDGEWDVPDFGAFSERMKECYSFLYAIDALSSPGINLTRRKRFMDAFENYPWRGGGSPLNFYNDLYDRVPANDRLGVETIRYASPGHIEIRGSAAIFDDLSSILRTFTQNYGLAGQRYRELRQYLHSQKLLSSSKDTVRGTSDQQAAIVRYLDDLGPAIGFENMEQVLAYSQGNWVLCAKIVLSFFRRLNKLFQFYAEGRASLPSSDPPT